jgi:hypothetical protein
MQGFCRYVLYKINYLDIGRFIPNRENTHQKLAAFTWLLIN